MDIKLGLVDLGHLSKTKEVRYDHYTICRENVADVLETDFAIPPHYDWYREEKETVRDLMLAGF